MKPSEILKVRVYDGTNWQDITSGTLNVNTKYGTDTFQGFWDQPDTGQFSIVSRGSTSDPNINPLIQTNAVISIMAEFEQPGPEEPYIYYTPSLVYLGFITDVNVEYIKNEKQIVTINGTDLIGFLNRVVLTQDYIDANITPTYPDSIVPVSFLINEAVSFTPTPTEGVNMIFFSQYNVKAEPSSLADAVNLFPSLPNSPRVKVEAGKTLYDLISSGSSTGLITYETEDYTQLDFDNNYSPLPRSYYTFFPSSKYDATYYEPINLYFARDFAFHIDMLLTNLDDPIQDADFAEIWGPYRTGGTFKNVKINNGFDQIINQVSSTNTDPATNEFSETITSTDEEQLALHGPARLESYTGFTTTSNPFWLSTSTISSQIEQYQKDILQYQAEPVKGISSVIIDYTNNEIANPEIGNELYVQHKISENNYIYGYYVVSGIRHNITRDDWTTELILRDSEYQRYETSRPKVPVIELNKTYDPINQSYFVSTAESITASISNYTTQDFANIERIEWMVNIPLGDADPNKSKYRLFSPPSQDIAATDQGSNFPSNIPIFTGQTVTWNYDDQGVLAPYGPEFYGPMSNGYQIAVWITNKQGYTTCYQSDFNIVVGSAIAFADFNASVDSYGVVTFTDASGSDTNSWEWNFGDGTTYTGETPPKKTYAAAGTYNVTLTVNNGFDFDSVVKPVTITSITIPVQYIRLRFQGTVTKAAGETDYTTDLIDSVGGLRIRNLSSVDTNSIMPFYLHARTLDKVQLVSETPYVTAPLSAPAILPSAYDPEIIDTPGDYYGQGALNPMSQNYWSGWSSTGGGRAMKYKFHPVITDNPDGSQTKTYDFDLTFEYSQMYGTPDDQNPWYNNNLYAPGGNPAQVAYWPQWGAGGSSLYDQRYKIQNIWYYPGNPLQVYTNTSETDFTPLLVDTIGNLETGKTYLPIEISVAGEALPGQDLVFRKVGTATYDGVGQPFVTTFLQAMPPKTTLPIQE